MGYMHTDKNGRIVHLCQLGDKHLKNIILFIEMRARKGIIIRSIGTDDFWYEIKGRDALEHMHYDEYVAERESRSVGANG